MRREVSEGKEKLKRKRGKRGKKGKGGTNRSQVVDIKGRWLIITTLITPSIQLPILSVFTRCSCHFLSFLPSLNLFLSVVPLLTQPHKIHPKDTRRRSRVSLIIFFPEGGVVVTIACSSVTSRRRRRRRHTPCPSSQRHQGTR